jgi:O-acetyl-ADP-ribose deacetylase (regulator of RNase III)
VAFPAISCGAFGWEAPDAAPIAVAAVRAYAAQHPESGIERVRFVLFDDATLAAFRAALAT